MNAFRKKLHSNRGASMLIALIYFFVAMMVGTVVLVAASGNAGRVSHNRQEQQEYYAVASAVKLIRDGVASCDSCDLTGLTPDFAYTLNIEGVEGTLTVEGTLKVDGDGNITVNLHYKDTVSNRVSNPIKMVFEKTGAGTWDPPTVTRGETA